MRPRIAVATVAQTIATAQENKAHSIEMSWRKKIIAFDAGRYFYLLAEPVFFFLNGTDAMREIAPTELHRIDPNTCSRFSGRTHTHSKIETRTKQERK